MNDTTGRAHNSLAINIDLQRALEDKVILFVRVGVQLGAGAAPFVGDADLHLRTFNIARFRGRFTRQLAVSVDLGAGRCIRFFKVVHIVDKNLRLLLRSRFLFLSGCFPLRRCFPRRFLCGFFL